MVALSVTVATPVGAGSPVGTTRVTTKLLPLTEAIGVPASLKEIAPVVANAGGANVNISPDVTRIDAVATLRTRSRIVLTDQLLRMVFTAFVTVHEDPSITIERVNRGESYHFT
jgi:hypothetical protein